jgi:hypothetical protein
MIGDLMVVSAYSFLDFYGASHKDNTKRHFY